MSLVQTIQGNGGGYVNSYTFSITPTAGNMLTLAFGTGAADTLTITDTKSNSWLSDVSIINTGNRLSTLYHVENVAGGATTVTIQFGSGQYNDSAYICQEWSGMATSSDLDKVVSAITTSGTSYATGNTATTTQANELIVASIAADSSTPSFTGDSNFTNLITQAGFDLYTSVTTEYRLVSSTGAYGITMTSGSARQTAQVLATYTAVASAVTPAIPLLIIGN